ncbi:MAG: DMT family transporter [Rhodobacterales bacterium]|nr:DMT family transporter [Rhodobacterales bacterium]
MRPNQAITVALLAALAWGIGNVAQKTIFEHLDGWAATGITSIVGAAVLLPLARREDGASRIPARGSWGLLAALSLVFTVASTLMQFSYGLTTVTNAGFLTNTSAVLTPILAWACFRQHPALAIWPASLLALLGIFLMAGARLGNLSPGDLLALSSAVAYAFWTLMVGIYVMRTRRPILMTAVQLAVCGTLCTGIGAALNGPPTVADLVAALPEILFIGLVSKGLAFMLMAVSQQHISATSIGVIVSAEAVFGAMIAAVLLGETMDVPRGIGSLCIILGVVIAARIPSALPEMAMAETAMPEKTTPEKAIPETGLPVRSRQP